MPTRTHCFVDQKFENNGQAELTYLLFVRERSQRPWDAGVFLMDMGCLGVKDAFSATFTSSELDQFRKKVFPNGYREEPAAWGRKLFEDAVAYGKSLGFKPPRDVKKAARVLGGVRAADCDETFHFGRDGKPFYVQGALHSDAKARRVLNHLTQRLGSDGFHFLVEDGVLPPTSVVERVNALLEEASKGKRTRKTKARLDELADEFPDNADVCYGQGVVRLMENHHETALPFFERAVELEPDFVEAWMNKAITHTELEDEVGVVHSYRKVVELTPPDSELHATAEERLETFAAVLREATGMEIDELLQAEKLFSEASDLVRAGEYDEAIRIILKNPDGLPANEKTLTLLGLCYRKRGEIEVAREVLTRALDLNPDNPAAAMQLGFIEADERGVDIEDLLRERLEKLIGEARNS